MSRHDDMPSSVVEVLGVRRRHRYSAVEKQRMVEQTYQPRVSLSEVAGAHQISPRLLVRRRKLAGEGALRAVRADEAVVPASEDQRRSARSKSCRDCWGRRP